MVWGSELLTNWILASKVDIVMMSIEKTVSLDQRERNPDGDS